MKKSILFCCFLAIWAATSCGSRKGVDAGINAPYTPPSAGTIITADSMKITGGNASLNNFKFTVTVTANDNTQTYGVYNVVAKWGLSPAAGQFTMPRGGEKLKPILKKGTDPYTYIIGFQQGDDPTFYDYYQVTGNNGIVEMKYIKAYSFK